MDWHWGKIVNNGLFLVRSTPWSKRFLDELWDYRPRRDLPDAACPQKVEGYGLINNWLEVCGGARSYWLGDQGGFHALIRSSRYPSDYLCHVKW